PIVTARRSPIGQGKKLDRRRNPPGDLTGPFQGHPYVENRPFECQKSQIPWVFENLLAELVAHRLKIRQDLFRHPALPSAAISKIPFCLRSRMASTRVVDRSRRAGACRSVKHSGTAALGHAAALIKLNALSGTVRNHSVRKVRRCCHEEFDA